MKRLFAALVLALSILAVVTQPRAALAADHGPAQRVVSGRVLDDASAPVKDAVVYLKDMHTLVVKSYIASADGAYRFGQLSANTDYEIWAVAGGKKSKVRTISSFDTKTQFTIDLKL
jgi:hypothetical protein